MLLVPGQNTVLGACADLRTAMVGVTWVGEVDVDVCAVGLTDAGKVFGDEWLIFWNNVWSPDQAVHLRQTEPPEGVVDRAQVFLDLSGLPQNVHSVQILLATVTEPDLGGVHSLRTRTVDLRDGSELACFTMAHPMVGRQCGALVTVYRHQEDWKLRAVGQAYSSLREVASDLGVNLT